MRLTAPALLCVLAGCAGSDLAIRSDAARRLVTVDGVSVIVAPLDGGGYVATREAVSLSQTGNRAIDRAFLARAVEAATGCKVTAAELREGARQAMLDAAVDCRQRP